MAKETEMETEMETKMETKMEELRVRLREMEEMEETLQNRKDLRNRRRGEKTPIQHMMKNLLPVSSRDVANTLVEGNVLNWRGFLRILVNIPPQIAWILLTLCFGYVSSQSKEWTSVLDFQSGQSTKTPPQSLLSFREAFHAFFPNMKLIAEIMLCYVVPLLLVCSLHPAVQISCVLVLICATLFNLPELWRKASGLWVHVACGSFKLPLIWFVSLGALGLFLIIILLTLLLGYFIWRFTYKRRPRVEETEVNLDGFSEILTGGNG